MSKIKYQGNPQYKDNIFCMLFGREEYKGNIASLCSALEGKEYTAQDVVEINTIEDAVYIKMKNDVSFLLENYMFLWEHQSTINPNMPLRGFMYFSELYSAYLDRIMMNIHSTSLVRIPTPKYIVFYNGEQDAPPVSKYRLSDAFINPEESGEYEWTATMLNINPGKNDELLLKCRPLKEYMTFVEYVRYYRGKGRSPAEGIDMAVDRCIDEGILVDFLAKHRAEVRKMIITDQKRQIEILEADAERKGFSRGHERGMKEGMKEGMQKGMEKERAMLIEKLMKNTGCSREKAMEMLDIDNID